MLEQILVIDIKQVHEKSMKAFVKMVSYVTGVDTN